MHTPANSHQSRPSSNCKEHRLVQASCVHARRGYRSKGGAGLSVKGLLWGRSDATLGLAGRVNALSPEHRRYLATGGYGFIIGEGKLGFVAEQNVKSYYDWKVVNRFPRAANIQFVAHPAYNRDPGPAMILALRVHPEF